MATTSLLFPSRSVVQPDPCPFCGGGEIRIETFQQMTPKGFYPVQRVKCATCKGTGPEVFGDEVTQVGQDACIVKWNTRVRTQ